MDLYRGKAKMTSDWIVGAAVVIGEKAHILGSESIFPEPYPPPFFQLLVYFVIDLALFPFILFKGIRTVNFPLQITHFFY